MSIALSVIVPTLNEAENLPRLLGELSAQRDVALEIIVADGGSQDATVELALQAGAQLVRSPAGRGRQMNAGAAAASAPLLLFLHADSQLRDPELLRRALAAFSDSATVAGHFALRFARNQAGFDTFFRRLEAKTRVNRRDAIHGDQGLLIQRRFLDRLGGFSTRLPFLEDWALAQQIAEQGRWQQLPGELWTSARRFEQEGHLPRYLLMGTIVALFEAGADRIFEDVPRLYAEQRHARRLDLLVWRRPVRRAMFAGGPWPSLKRHWRLGRFIHRQAWQLALSRDLARGLPAAQHPGPALRFYERWLEPLVNAPLLRQVLTLPCVLIGAVMIYSDWYWRRGLAEVGRLERPTRPAG